MSAADTKQPIWSSRMAFLLAAIGFSVGLGNIWKFPYVTGQNGGGAFVLVYLLCACAVGVPILIAEIAIGRIGRAPPTVAMRKIAAGQGQSRHWGLVGAMNLVATFIIQVFYCVIAGWVLRYLFSAAVDGFASTDNRQAADDFEQLLADPATLLFWTLVAVAVTFGIIYSGLHAGVERAVSVLMPALFLLLAGLVAFNVFQPGFTEAWSYLFTPDFSRINPSVILAAIGQAFFSIGIAMATMMTYGAYLPKEISIPRSSLAIVLADTSAAILAGLAIFPVVFRFGMNPESGTGLVFETLPVAFAQMPGGHLVGTVFFVMLAFAAITSMVGGYEAMTNWLEQNSRVSRHTAAAAVSICVGTLGSVSVLGYNVLANVGLAGRSINDLLIYVTDAVLLPLGGLLSGVFVAWFIDRNLLADELAFKNRFLFRAWHFLLRFIVPVAVFLVFVLGVAG